MNLKTRLALLYSLSVFIILLASAGSIHLLNENFRKEEFIKRLVIEASENYQLFTNSQVQNNFDHLNANVKNALREEKIYIYDSSFRLKYSSPGAKPIEVSNKLFENARAKKYQAFSIEKNEAVILFGQHPNNFYYTIATATDVFGRSKGNNLKLLLIFSVLGGILLSGILAFFYVKQAMKPLEELKAQIEKIDEGNLTERIQVKRKNDEVWQIARKFNEMLERLEQAFEQQKNFVQHASHELRTPLANMLTHTESALSKNLSAGEFKRVLLSLKEDQQNLIELINSLLALSKYEAISSVSDVTPVRIDEILYQTVELINEVWPTAIINLDFVRIPEDEEYLAIEGNEALIRSAIHNVVKNAILYSDDYKAKISIDATRDGIKLEFDNVGKQLLPGEQSLLFIPFFRGENSVFKKGYGLGLSIVDRIIKLHKGTLTYQSIGNNLNKFVLFLPAQL